MDKSICESAAMVTVSIEMNNFGYAMQQTQNLVYSLGGSADISSMPPDTVNLYLLMLILSNI